MLVLTGKGEKTRSGGRAARRHADLRRSRRGGARDRAMSASERSCARPRSRSCSSSSPRRWRSSRCSRFPCPPLTRYRIISAWSRSWCGAPSASAASATGCSARRTFPREPCIILAKHESAWETLAFQVIFPPQVWVVKRELLWIPFFGWGLAMLSPIAIDRRRGARALEADAGAGPRAAARGLLHRDLSRRHARRARVRGRLPGRAARGSRCKTGAPVAAGSAQCGHVLAAQRVPQAPGTITVSIGPVVRAGRQESRRAHARGRTVDRKRDAADTRT